MTNIEIVDTQDSFSFSFSYKTLSLASKALCNQTLHDLSVYCFLFFQGPYLLLPAYPSPPCHCPFHLPIWIVTQLHPPRKPFLITYAPRFPFLELLFSSVWAWPYDYFVYVSLISPALLWGFWRVSSTSVYLWVSTLLSTFHPGPTPDFHHLTSRFHLGFSSVSFMQPQKCLVFCVLRIWGRIHAIAVSPHFYIPCRFLVDPFPSFLLSLE